MLRRLSRAARKCLPVRVGAARPGSARTTHRVVRLLLLVLGFRCSGGGEGALQGLDQDSRQAAEALHLGRFLEPAVLAVVERGA